MWCFGLKRLTKQLCWGAEASDVWWHTTDLRSFQNVRVSCSAYLRNNHALNTYHTLPHYLKPNAPGEQIVINRHSGILRANLRKCKSTCVNGASQVHPEPWTIHPMPYLAGHRIAMDCRDRWSWKSPDHPCELVPKCSTRFQKLRLSS